LAVKPLHCTSCHLSVLHTRTCAFPRDVARNLSNFCDVFGKGAEEALNKCNADNRICVFNMRPNECNTSIVFNHGRRAAPAALTRIVLLLFADLGVAAYSGRLSWSSVTTRSTFSVLLRIR
jgi:hypothetical protein